MAATAAGMVRKKEKSACHNRVLTVFPLPLPEKSNFKFWERSSVGRDKGRKEETHHHQNGAIMLSYQKTKKQNQSNNAIIDRFSPLRPLSLSSSPTYHRLYSPPEAYKGPALNHPTFHTALSPSYNFLFRSEFNNDKMGFLHLRRDYFYFE